HTGLAEIEHDAFDRIASGQTELNGGLYRDANRTAPFATQKSSRSPQTRRGLLGSEGLVQDELRTCLQDFAHAAFIAEKSNGHEHAGGGLGDRLKQMSSNFRLVEIDNQAVETLLGKAMQSDLR